MQLIYDGHNRLTARRDAVGNLTRFDYDPVGNISSQQKWGPRGGVSPVNNTGVNNVLLAETGFLYDELNRLYQLDRMFQDETGVTAQDGVLTPDDGQVTYQFVYDRASRLIQRTDDNNHLTAIDYDGVNRRLQITDALGNSKKYRYDKSSNLIQINLTEVDPEQIFSADNYQWQVEYDELNRATTLIDNLDNITGYSYDSRHTQHGAKNRPTI